MDSHWPLRYEETWASVLVPLFLYEFQKSTKISSLSESESSLQIAKDFEGKKNLFTQIVTI